LAVGLIDLIHSLECQILHPRTSWNGQLSWKNSRRVQLTSLIQIILNSLPNFKWNEGHLNPFLEPTSSGERTQSINLDKHFPPYNFLEFWP
jgi:hypothetical protein